MTSRLVALIAAAALAWAAPSPGEGAVRVVTTTEDLAALVRAVGGDAVTVEAIARGYQDPHFVEPKPSFILMLARADLLVVVGRDLERAWLPPLITQSRNARIQPGASGYLDASLTARILEIPAGQITRAMGDVHPLGNPHYWLDPDNGRRIAQVLRDRLSAMSPDDGPLFARRYEAFDRELAQAETRWDRAMAPFRGTKVVTYHRSWPNFAERFGLDVIGYVEPRPGIPPSPRHILELTAEMQRLGIGLILCEPYFDLKTPESIAGRTGAEVIVLPPSVGGVPEIETYLDLFDYDIDLLVSALSASGK